MGKKLAKGLYWRGGVAQVRTDPVDGRQRSTGLTTAEAANLWLTEREKLAASPSYAASTRASVGEWVLKSLAHKRSQGRSEGTLHMYGVKLGHVARIFGVDSMLATITPGAVDDYIAQRKTEGAVNNTIARELTCMRQLLRLARRAGAFGRGLDEVMPIGFSANYTPVTRTLTWEQFSKVLLPALDGEIGAWVRLAVATAGDFSDVERMTREDFDTKRWVVRMRGTKNKARSAVIPIPELFQKLVKPALRYLPVSWPRASKQLGEITAKLGLGHYSPKDLRRSACTWLVEGGVPEDAVSRWMRHRNSTMVRMIYGQMRPEALGSIIDERLQKRDTDRGPLGGIGRRRGFKSRSALTKTELLGEILDLARRELARPVTPRRTETLQATNRLRLARLRVFEVVDPVGAGPGLAVCRGLEAALAGDLDAVERELLAGAKALGGVG